MENFMQYLTPNYLFIGFITLFIILFIFMIYIFIRLSNPEYMVKRLGTLMKAQKEMINTNEDDMKEMSNKLADISVESIEKMASSFKKGLK